MFFVGKNIQKQHYTLSLRLFFSSAFSAFTGKTLSSQGQCRFHLYEENPTRSRKIPYSSFLWADATMIPWLWYGLSSYYNISIKTEYAISAYCTHNRQSTIIPCLLYFILYNYNAFLLILLIRKKPCNRKMGHLTCGVLDTRQKKKSYNNDNMIRIVYRHLRITYLHI